MKKKKILLKINAYGIAVAILAAVGFLVAAFIVDRQENGEPFIWHGIAGICMILAAVGFLIYFQVTKSKWYQEYLHEKRLDSLEKFKQTAKIPSFKFDTDFGTEREEQLERLNELLGEAYEQEDLPLGKLFYSFTDSPLNPAKSMADAFFVPYDNGSFEYEKEKSALLASATQIETFLKTKNETNEFINCVALFFHESLDDIQKDFYYNFSGSRQSELQNNIPAKNKVFTICGLDTTGKQAFFYLPLTSDSGKEAILNDLIVEALKLSEN
ncbi:MAG: hypothetical protein FWC82_01490 [Firmicutes bacterium]|nr:hypothetical protein [Bacillota bacterium]